MWSLWGGLAGQKPSWLALYLANVLTGTARFDLRACSEVGAEMVVGWVGGGFSATGVQCLTVCCWRWVCRGLPVAPAVGGAGGVTAQLASLRHVACGDVIANSVFLTLLSRGCGFCGRASKGALFAPVSKHDVMEMGGGGPKPLDTWRKWGLFPFLSYFWLLIQCLTCLLISKCSSAVILRKPYACVSE